MVLLVERTVSFKSRIEDQHLYKLIKYEDLTKAMEGNFFLFLLKPIEIGARGIVAGSMNQLAHSAWVQKPETNRNPEEAG